MPLQRVAAICLTVTFAALVGCASGAGAPGTSVSGAARDDAPCVDLPRVAEATMLFDPGLKGPGTFDLEVEIDGEKESCTITLGDPRPAVQMGGVVGIGRADMSTTCALVTLEGTFSDGSLAGVTRAGKSASVRVKISEQGKAIAEGTFRPDYTPDRCGQMKRLQKLAIAR